MLKRKIAILGAGSWGTAFAKVIADTIESAELSLWTRQRAVADEITRLHANSRYLSGVKLPANMHASNRIEEVLKGADVVAIAVPSHVLRDRLKEWKHLLPRQSVLVSLMKGMELGTEARMSQVIQEETGFPARQTVIVSGPDIAIEVANGLPATATIACDNKKTALMISRLCTISYFHPHISSDVIGTELGGITKNIVALAVGMCEGIGLGNNMKAVVIAQGFLEMKRFTLARGGMEKTAMGPAGLGDLVVTCMSPSSRNYMAGDLLGRGLSRDQVLVRISQVVEGIWSAPVIFEIAKRIGIAMPITETVVAFLNGTIERDSVVNRFFAR